MAQLVSCQAYSEDTEKTGYPRCLEFGFQYTLKESAYLPGQPITSDDNLWKGQLVPIYELKEEG